MRKLKGIVLQTQANMNTVSQDNIMTPKMVRDMLNLNNSQIENLCKSASIKLKKDSKGLTYFTKNDVDVLKNFTDSKSKSLQSKLALFHSQQQNIAVKNQMDNASMNQLLQSLKNIEETITEKIATIMDEKLDGMDDVVVELIRCKTENETLRFKMNELNKENYNLKNELSSFKNVAMNVYVKKNNGSTAVK